ncbi:MAG TPA: carbon starvation protein A [Firmicutes bacterium]|nr:carbon starvation protein A [Bacillota bacterium]
MVTFIGCIVVLILGYLFYGAFVERVFGVDREKSTPAYTLRDGVDYVPMDWKKVFLIQFLNIAGLGPVYGAIQGALWGPSAFLWIVLGGILVGGAHDYISGMLSVRENGASMGDVIGKYLGNKVRWLMNVVLVVLLILVGVVFATGPAALLQMITPSWMTYNFWVAVIFIYYLLATLLPIDALIGRIYPFFGACLLIMVIGIGGGMIVKGMPVPQITLANLHPKNLPIWPLMFISIACGAISGFHFTQSPMMARCIMNEGYGRRVFYGAMIAESIVALTWAAASLTFFEGTSGLSQALGSLGGPGGVVKDIAFKMMGTVGGVLAVLGVVVLPITTGDTAFRACRMMIGEILHLDPKPIANRLKIAIPIFIIAIILTQVNFDVIWRYFAWCNQTVAIFTLFACSAYLAKNGKFHWVTTIPAGFMCSVSFTYILNQPIGFNLPMSIAAPVGLVAAAAVFVHFLYYLKLIAQGTVVFEPALKVDGQ